ncbi:DUF2169 family type VI secretion system accessory protein [Pantoea rwandensis]|uniref:DUF2169 domain-containing protein n=1 Tax=Pantoea rwandensis TaxID=1076550 RepID=A0A1X1CSQ5_9GAMM|nr:DUF2169 domain-containing protein [Pantoea rwandensis]ORM67380.1 hypothetical protein HA51_19925 [Pantoea rwandensis]
MKIIKPLHLSVITRSYRWQQQHHLGVSLMALMNMDALPRLLTEQAMWQCMPETLQSPDGVLDLGLPKQHPEFLASGFAFPAGGPAPQCDAAIQVGEKRKVLRVFGHRDWQQDQLTAPQPFSSMPLDWQHAMGGEHDEENPFGQPLPHVESPDRLLTHPDQRPLPASFNALPFTATRRFSRLGNTFDEQWLQNEYPGFARDTDWRVFNQAETDQWWTTCDALPAGAHWRIENMHPNKPVLQGVLPPWQGRCFISRLQHDGDLFEEISLRATTVHFFPHLEQLLLIWHGSTVIQEDDAADVTTLLAALEHCQHPKTAAHYQSLMEKRSDPEQSVLLAMRHSDLLPAGSVREDDDGPEALSPMQENLASWQRLQRERLREDLASNGMDVNKLAPVEQKPRPVAMDEIHDYLEREEQQAQQQLQQMIARYEAEEARFGEASPAHPTSAITQYRQQQQQLAEDLPDPKQHAQVQQALYDNYRFTAPELDSPTRLTPEQSQQVRQAVMARDGDCRKMDLTGADLSGLDLRHYDFSHALLEAVDFSHCQLEGSLFSHAMLARAEFHHSQATDCAFDNANLALAQCYYTDFSGSVFSEVDCRDLLLEQCIFDRALLHDLTISSATLAHCRFHGAQLESCTFLEITLQSLDFSHATLRKVSFIECHLLALLFTQAQLRGVGWITCQAPEIDFQHAQLNDCVFAAGTQLPRARFNGARMTQCNLRGCLLQQSQFRLAHLVNSDLSEADCSQADMRQLQANDCQFIRTRFQQARLTDSNLTGAFMSKTQLQGCDLSGCNLFRTDIAQSWVDKETRFDDAWTSGMKSVPSRDKARG